jgi:hypothetical protein
MKKTKSRLSYLQAVNTLQKNTTIGNVKRFGQNFSPFSADLSLARFHFRNMTLWYPGFFG